MTAPDPTPLRDRLITALAVAGGWNPNRLEPHDFQDEAAGVLAIVQPEVDAKDTDIRRLRTELAMAQSGPLALDRDSWRRLAGLANERADRIAAERDRAMAGVPLICSDDRHQAKVRALEAERDQLRAQAARARAFSTEMRNYCSPHGISALYADRLDSALDGPKET